MVMHPFIETVDAQMDVLFRESPGFSAQKSGRGNPTRGHFETAMEVHFLPFDDYQWPRDFRRGAPQDPKASDGHEFRRHIDGYAIGAPGAWQRHPYYSVAINISFDWDDCCGYRLWHYSAEPDAPQGDTRWRYSLSNPLFNINNYPFWDAESLKLNPVNGL
jgi:hypothetical protein